MWMYCASCFGEEDCLYRKATDEVICMSCGKPVTVSDFMKRVFQQDKSQHVQEAVDFPVQCNHCRQKVSAVLDKDEQCICSNCGKRISLSSFMLLSLKEAGRYLAPKVDQEEEKSGESIRVRRDS